MLITALCWIYGQPLSVVTPVQWCCSESRSGASAGPWAAKMGKGKVGTGHWWQWGTQLVSHRGWGWCSYPARRSSAITNVKERSLFLLWYSENQARKDGTAFSRWHRKGRAVVGFRGRAVFSLIPHFVACFWHEEAQVYSLAVYVARSPTLKRNQRKEQGERHTNTPEQPRQKRKLIKMMMLIIIWYVK